MKEIYAQLALWAYRTESMLPKNRPFLPGPEGTWEDITESVANVSAINASYAKYSFACKVSRNIITGEVVVAYRGTDNIFLDFAIANIPLGVFGSDSPQLSAAALVAGAVLDQYGDNVSFTGHSLGAGLAASMGAMFDRPAYGFDTPVKMLTNNLELVSSGLQSLAQSPSWNLPLPTSIADAWALRGRSLVSMIQQEYPSAYLRMTGLAGAGAIQQSMAARVNSWYLERDPLNSFLPFGESVPFNSAGIADPQRRLQAHRMDLLTASLMVPKFSQVTSKSDEIAFMLTNGNFYGEGMSSARTSSLMQMIKSEQANVGNGALTHWSHDMEKFGDHVRAMSTVAQRVLVAYSIDWYIYQSTGYAQEFFTLTDNGLQFQPFSNIGYPVAGQSALTPETAYLASLMQTWSRTWSDYSAARIDIAKVSFQQMAVVANVVDGSLTAVNVGMAQRMIDYSVCNETSSFWIAQKDVRIVNYIL